MVKANYGDRVYVDSVGLRQGTLDPLAVVVMKEIGIDISGHRPKLLDHMMATSFDVIVTLTPEAQHRAVELTRSSACEVVCWRTFDPSLVEGNREVRLTAYRAAREALCRQIGVLLGGDGEAP